MKITIRFFALGRELVGSPNVSLEVPDTSTVGEILTILKAQYPALSSLPSCLLAVNNVYADNTVPLNDGDELALIPPVSGG